MQYKYRKTTKLPRYTPRRTRALFAAAMYFVAIVVSLAVSTHVAFAANDASLTLSPADGTYTVGSQLTVTVSESSSAADNTQAVFVTLMYSDSLLQYEGSSQGTFQPCDIQQTVSGEIDISCNSSIPVSGTQSVASVAFKVTAAGDPSVSVDPSSDIQDINGNSVWDGNIAVSSFTANAPGATSGGTGGSGGGSSSGSSGSAAGSTAGAKSSSSSPAGSSPPPAPGAANNQATAGAAASDASLTLIVTDSNNHNISGAKVIVDGNRTAYTNAQGELVLDGLASGSHALAITAAGKLSSKSTVTLRAGENKVASFKLTDQAPSLGIYPYVIFGITVAGILAYILMKRGGFITWQQHPQPTMPGAVVGVVTPVITPAPSPVPFTRHRFAISKYGHFDDHASANRPPDDTLHHV